MRTNDPRCAEAENHIAEAIQILKVTRQKHLDHTDVTTVKTALEGLGIVQRSIAGPSQVDNGKIAARLQQVAAAIKSCDEPSAITAYAPVATAAQIFLSVAAESCVS